MPLRQIEHTHSMQKCIPKHVPKLETGRPRLSAVIVANGALPRCARFPPESVVGESNALSTRVSSRPTKHLLNAPPLLCVPLPKADSS